MASPKKIGIEQRGNAIRKVAPPVYYTLTNHSRRLTIKITTEADQNKTGVRFIAIPTTGVMRGHDCYKATGDTASEAIRQCLAKIAGLPITDPLNKQAEDALFATDLASDALAKRHSAPSN